MRTCRRCSQPFEPAKPYYWWCSLPCRRADYLEAQGQPYTAGDVGRAFDRGYQRGYELGLAEGRRRVRTVRTATLPLDTWRQLASLVHPDRYDGTPLAAAAHAAMVWLNA